MTIIPGQCIVCQAQIAQGGRPLANYCEDHFLTEDDTCVIVGRCANCKITPEEWGEVDAALRASLPRPLGGIVKHLKSMTFMDVLREIQGGKCPCGSDLGDVVYPDGVKLRCGRCNVGKAGGSHHEEPCGGAMSRARKELK